jgi:hypothetical protein
MGARSTRKLKEALIVLKYNNHSFVVIIFLSLLP